MQVTAIKTHKITEKDTDILKVLDTYVFDDSGHARMTEGSVLAVTSKIVSICEGRMVKIDPHNPDQKDQLIAEESEIYLPREENSYHVSLAISHDMLSASAGIDESNANGYYILWPKDAQASANMIREHILSRSGLDNIGVIITDSKTSPMRWGVTAIAIGYSGFEPLKNYIHTPDIFGRPFAYEQMSIIDNLASAAALTMGEGAEQTPLSIISDVPMVTFTGRNPTSEELAKIKITMHEDLYGNFLKNAPWKKGRVKRDWQGKLSKALALEK